jgi:sarcosine oxidase, subunit delta
MKLLRCPINGIRPLQEFYYGGEVRVSPDAAMCSGQEWTDYVFNRSGEPRICFEWWRHEPSGAWFVAERDTVKDEFIKTYSYEEYLNRE